MDGSRSDPAAEPRRRSPQEQAPAHVRIGRAVRGRYRLIESVQVSQPSAQLAWKTALAMLDAGQVADFLESRTPRAKRMRISSPFFWPAR